VYGARRAMRKGSPLLWPTVIRVHLGAPVETAGLTIEARAELAATVQDRVAALLADAAEADAAASPASTS
jgi:hypothetical protein